jgi:two-component system, LytTR family, response regulator
MRALIVDDETLARVEMRQLLGEHVEVEVVGEAARVGDALELTGHLRPDVVFLDIQLVGETGFDYVGLLPDEGGPHIVFVTAFDRYAIRGFECNALDYLLKPVNSKRLAETLRRVHKHEALRQPAGEDDAVFIKAGSVARFVPWRQIVRVTTNGNYTRVHLVDGSELVVLRTLKEWLTLIPEGMYLQTHRSTMVRRTAVREIIRVGEKRHEVQLDDGSRVPVGREFLTALREALL